MISIHAFIERSISASGTVEKYGETCEKLYLTTCGTNAPFQISGFSRNSADSPLIGLLRAKTLLLGVEAETTTALNRVFLFELSQPL